MTAAHKPDFFIVGAPKSGTTAMAQYLSVHPEIHMSYRKEMHYFGADLERIPHYYFVDNEKEYLSRFKPPASAKVIGEASVNYLLSASAPAEIKAFSPNSRILIMLRNPVEMLYSYHSQLLWGTYEDITDFSEALAAEPDRKAGRRLPKCAMMRSALYYREVANYVEQVQRYFEVFGRDAVHVILFDDFREDLQREFLLTQEFLGVSPFELPKFKVVNPNKVTRLRWLMELIQLQPAPINWALALMPDELRYWFLGKLSRVNTRIEPRPPMPAELRAQLTAEFAPAAEKLGRLLNRDLSNWQQV